MSKLGEDVFFFSKHCLPDFGQLILAALLTSLCTAINFERAVMQEDEKLKVTSRALSSREQALKRQGHAFELAN